MCIELDTKVDSKDKGRHTQIKIDDLMSASTKPRATESPDGIKRQSGLSTETKPFKPKSGQFRHLAG